MSKQALFYPRSVAVIGASRDDHAVGNDIAENLVKSSFTGQVYLVNPKAEELFGKKVYHKIADLPGKIDLAIVVVPVKYVLTSLQEAQQKGAQAVIIISAGFKEVGQVELEQEIAHFCQKHEMTLVGPNCLGIINPELQLNASFAKTMPTQGSIAFVSQSGALCTAVLDYAQELDLGFSKFVSLGNKADLDELQLIEYLAQDPQTKVMTFYIEQLENAPALIKAIKKVTRGPDAKPIIMLKAGRTQAGQRAVASHTGSLSSSDVAYQALFDQAGVIRAESMTQLFAYAAIFSHHPPQAISSVAIVTNAGGPGVIATDEVIKSGLNLAALQTKTKTKLQQFLPAAASLENPVDILGDADAKRYQQALDTVISDEQVEALLVLLTPQSMTEIEATAQAIVATQQTTDKPILACFMGHNLVEPGLKILKAHDVVTTTFPEAAAQALAAYGQFGRWTQTQPAPAFSLPTPDQEKAHAIMDQVKQAGRQHFLMTEALALLQTYGFAKLETVQAKTAHEAEEIVVSSDKSWAMKIVSAEISHKSDVGGVALNINADNVQTEYEAMMKRVKENRPKAKLKGVLLMEMAPQDGIEVILGANKVPDLGTMLMFGLGGIYVEIFKDVSFAFAPLTENDAQRMLNQLRSKSLFAGARGQKAVDETLLIECIGRLSQLVTDFPQIVELDINPLLALPGEGEVKMLDARVVIEN